MALSVDMGVFLAALTLGADAVLAAALGYSTGIIAHWLMSSRAVFVGGLAEGGTPRRQQQLLFLLSALVGLALTMAIVALGDRLGIDPRLAKLVAVATSFQATYLLRRHMVFA